MKTITEQELLKIEVEYNKRWQDVIDIYQRDCPGPQLECAALMQLLHLANMNYAGMVFSLAIIKLELAVGHQTGKAYTAEDLEDTNEEAQEG